MFSSPVIYLQVHTGFIVAKRLNGPVVQRQSAALSHPRTLMGSFLAVEQLFKDVLVELRHGFVRPKVLIHLLPQVEGGYTDVEERAFLEAAHGAGARRAKVVTAGVELSDAQVREALR